METPATRTGSRAQGEKEGGVEDVGLAAVQMEPPMGAEAEKAGEQAAP
jgi:hypothetical protein